MSPDIFGQPIVRAACDDDVAAIVALIAGYARNAIMLPRTPASVRDALHDFVVATTHDGTLLGCAALKEYSPSLAEVASVAVSEESHGRGIGALLVRAVETLAEKRGVDELFALTLTPGFFERSGYSVTDRARYPEKIRRDCLRCPRRIRCDEVCVGKRVAGDAERGVAVAA